jgi:hypothetical protein
MRQSHYRAAFKARMGEDTRPKPSGPYGFDEHKYSAHIQERSPDEGAGRSDSPLPPKPQVSKQAYWEKPEPKVVAPKDEITSHEHSGRNDSPLPKSKHASDRNESRLPSHQRTAQRNPSTPLDHPDGETSISKTSDLPKFKHHPEGKPMIAPLPSRNNPEARNFETSPIPEDGVPAKIKTTNIGGRET